MIIRIVEFYQNIFSILNDKSFIRTDLQKYFLWYINDNLFSNSHRLYFFGVAGHQITH